MVRRQFGAAGERILVEEHLQGPEVSVFVVSDGTRAIGFGTAQDHKRARDHDEGPNTGGMGAFAPSPLVDAALADRITREIVEPTIAGLREEGREFRGFLYAGLMLTADGPKVLEFNARLGDPEAQVVLPALDDDLSPLLRAAAAGSLGREGCRFRPGATVGVVLASGGYPDRYETGKPIAGLDELTGEPSGAGRTLVFHAGTALRDDAIVTSGGRVLTVVGEADDFESARQAAYRGVARIRFEGMHYRTDIGKKALHFQSMS
jgi:phosphoribosylamine--glycine ligase